MKMKSGYLKHFAGFIVLGIGLAGCNAVDRLQNIGGAPQLAPISDPTKDANYKPVTMPVAPPPGPRAENSLWLQGAHAFFHDPRANHIGDLITVDVSIADTAQVSNATTRTRANSDTANMTNFFGLENLITKNGANPASLIDMGSDTSNAGTGLINRSETINLTLAATVTQILANGNLVITGHQQVVVNNEMRDLQVSGIVRTEDITSDNTVNLAQVAEARVAYGGKGQITDVQQPRYGSQLLDILMPW
jgi:flagellar L-ring protein precursor FlgH